LTLQLSVGLSEADLERRPVPFDFAGKVYFAGRCYESPLLADGVRWDVAVKAEP
jgi:hypothetical protein